MIRVGEYVADETRGGVLFVRAIRCDVHGEVSRARLVLEAAGRHPAPTYVGYLLLKCPHCTHTVNVALERQPAPPPGYSAIADMPITAPPS